MAILKIIEYPDPLLRRQASQVTQFNATLATLIEDLIQTLHATPGIGLSAPQVARSLQVMVMDLTDDKRAPDVLINPRVLSKCGLAIADESCLSIPGVTAKVMRANAIRVKAQDQTGETIEREFEGMHAVCVQHEIDHLQGKLFIDRLSRFRRFRFRHQLRSLEHSTTASTVQAT